MSMFTETQESKLIEVGRNLNLEAYSDGGGKTSLRTYKNIRVFDVSIDKQGWRVKDSKPGSHKCPCVWELTSDEQEEWDLIRLKLERQLEASQCTLTHWFEEKVRRLLGEGPSLIVTLAPEAIAWNPNKPRSIFFGHPLRPVILRYDLHSDGRISATRYQQAQ